MTQQVAQRDVLRQIGIGQLEPRQMFCDRIVPAQFPFLDQDSEACRGEGLGTGRNGENRIRRHFPLRGNLTDAIATHENHFSVFDDGHGQSGDFPFLHRCFDVRVHPGKAVAADGHVRTEQQEDCAREQRSDEACHRQAIFRAREVQVLAEEGRRARFLIHLGISPVAVRNFARANSMVFVSFRTESNSSSRTLVSTGPPIMARHSVRVFPSTDSAVDLLNHEPDRQTELPLRAISDKPS